MPIGSAITCHTRTAQLPRPDSEEIPNWMEPPSNHFIPLVMTQLPFDPAEKLVLST